jgi:hypothetical protein
LRITDVQRFMHLQNDMLGSMIILSIIITSRAGSAAKQGEV